MGAKGAPAPRRTHESRYPAGDRAAGEQAGPGAAVSPGPPGPALPGRAGPVLRRAPAGIERARQLCGGCPVRVACLARALANHEPWGVWGGEILHRGAIIADKRGRGRPRKADIA